MIQVDSLVKDFGEIRALDHLSFHVNRGEILGFLGPNGAGKTTVMRILTGYLTPSAGTARVGDTDIVADSIAARKKIGYLPENVPLYRDLRVNEYLEYVAGLKGISRSNRQPQIQDVVDKCNLGTVFHRLVGNLSKGFRQRVGLAQALLGDPEVLILDEPTEGLDPKQIIEIRQLIKAFAGTKTVILSTHILPEVSMTCQRVIILNKGRLIAVDTPQNLNRSLQQRAAVSVTVNGPPEQVVPALEHLDGITAVRIESQSADGYMLAIETSTDRDIRSTIARTIVNGGWDLLELAGQTMSLEDIFIHLVTREEEVSQ